METNDQSPDPIQTRIDAYEATHGSVADGAVNTTPSTTLERAADAVAVSAAFVFATGAVATRLMLGYQEKPSDWTSPSIT